MTNNFILFALQQDLPFCCISLKILLWDLMKSERRNTLTKTSLLIIFPRNLIFQRLNIFWFVHLSLQFITRITCTLPAIWIIICMHCEKDSDPPPSWTNVLIITHCNSNFCSLDSNAVVRKLENNFNSSFFV